MIACTRTKHTEIQLVSVQGGEEGGQGAHMQDKCARRWEVRAPAETVEPPGRRCSRRLKIIIINEPGKTLFTDCSPPQHLRVRLLASALRRGNVAVTVQASEAIVIEISGSIRDRGHAMG